jgi:predicted dehydrogenase
MEMKSCECWSILRDYTIKGAFSHPILANYEHRCYNIFISKIIWEGNIMSKQAAIGVIGTSWWTEMMFLSVLQNYERANLLAICGRNQERANELAQKYGISEVYSDYRDMFAKSKLDGVIIASTDETHYEMAMAAFDAGLHVLCEKPVALNATHALEMLNKAEEKGLKHLVMYTHHWFPYLQRTKQLLTENYLGKVYHAYFQWFGSYAHDGRYNWRFDGNRSQGITADLGSHLIHMAQWLIGDVKSVIGQLAYHAPREGTPNPAHDSAQILLEFKNGTQLEMNLSAAAHIESFMRLSLALHGEKGVIEGEWSVVLPNSTTWIKAQQAGSDEKIHETGVADFEEYFRENPIGARLFVDGILDDKNLSPSLKEGYKVQQVIDAVIQSHETGCKVMIAD